MSHPITMSWTNQTTDTFTFGQVVVQEGTQPVASPATLGSKGSSAVSADQSHNFNPGPVGSYAWTNATNANQSISVSYNHPATTGTTSVTVTCSSAYQVSDDGETWTQNQQYTDSSLQQHSAVISLFIRAYQSGGGGIPPVDPDDQLIPLVSSMANKAAFVNSLFTPAVRSADDNQLNAQISDGAQVYDYADSNSATLILNAWLAGWQFVAGLPYDSGALSQCPEQDLALLKFLVPFVKDNQLCLAVPALQLESGGQSPPIYLSGGYQSQAFYDSAAASWNAEVISQFLNFLYYGAHLVLICSSADLNGGNAVANLQSALKSSGLPTRHDLYNSHYGASGGLQGTYYAPQGAPTPSLTQRDVETLASSAPKGQEPLIFSLVVGPTAASDPNCFLQLEGWPSQDVLLPQPGGARHSADYQANISLYWNFSTFGASVYSEKRSTPIFLCNSSFNLSINPATGMPSYTGAATLQDWMNPSLIVNS